jgi:hypothetical protein
VNECKRFMLSLEDSRSSVQFAEPVLFSHHSASFNAINVHWEARQTFILATSSETKTVGLVGWK